MKAYDKAKASGRSEDFQAMRAMKAHYKCARVQMEQNPGQRSLAHDL